MRYRTCVLAFAAVMGSADAAQAQRGLDEQSLKVAHETVISSISNGNLIVLQAMVHPQASGFFQQSERPVQLGTGMTAADILPTLVTDIGQFIAIKTSTTYRVVGPVGMVNLTALFDAKKFGQTDHYVRATYVYVSDGGNWRLVSWHGSAAPLKKK